MASIINPNRMGLMLGMFEDGKIPSLLYGIEHAVSLSFNEDKMKHPTEHEMKRRVDMCGEIVMELRGDCGWGLQRIVDALPRYLRARLNGSPLDPKQERTNWIITDGQ